VGSQKNSLMSVGLGQDGQKVKVALSALFGPKHIGFISDNPSPQECWGVCPTSLEMGNMLSACAGVICSSSYSLGSFMLFKGFFLAYHFLDPSLTTKQIAIG